MSAAKKKVEGDKSNGDNDNLPVAYEVGYGRPPAEHRFQKGQSGNPKGRPPGAKSQPRINNGHGMRAAEEYLRLEAYRPVRIREGEDLIELPAIQAVFRAMGVSAMKGNRFAQKTMAELITSLEASDYQSRFELFGNAVDYKHKWDQEIERCRRLGLPVPEPLPHPDDIILDTNTGGVQILGPQTKEQKAHYDKATARRQEAQAEVSYFAAKYRKETDPEAKEHWLTEWHWEQRMFDIINDSMRGRHQLKLEDRSYHPGASRAGETLREFVEDRKRPKGERRWGDYVQG